MGDPLVVIAGCVWVIGVPLAIWRAVGAGWRLWRRHQKGKRK